MIKRLTSIMPKHFLKYVHTVSNILTEDVFAEKNPCEKVFAENSAKIF